MDFIIVLSIERSRQLLILWTLAGFPFFGSFLPLLTLFGLLLKKICIVQQYSSNKIVSSYFQAVFDKTNLYWLHQDLLHFMIADIFSKFPNHKSDAFLYRFHKLICRLLYISYDYISINNYFF